VASEATGEVQARSTAVCGRLPDDARRDFGYLRTLPTDPAAMLRVLRERQSGEPDPDSRAFTAAGELMHQSYLPREQRAAVFRAAKLISGVAVQSGVQDAAGRAGIAVARVDEARGVRDELIFEPGSYRYLGSRRVVVDAERADAAGPQVAVLPAYASRTQGLPAPRTGHPAAPAGTVLVSSAELAVTVADSAPNFPSGGPSCG
jgi:hypothetical protein